MALVVVQLFNLSVQRILLQLKLLGLLPEDLVTDLSFQAKHGLLEEDE